MRELTPHESNSWSIGVGAGRYQRVERGFGRFVPGMRSPGGSQETSHFMDPIGLGGPGVVHDLIILRLGLSVRSYSRNELAASMPIKLS